MLRRLVSRIASLIADALISAALWLLDKLAGAEPETEADRIRAARRATLRKAFPRLLPEDRKKKRF